MYKIIIIVEVPVLHEFFEMRVSTDLQIGALVSLIAKVVETISDGIYYASGQEFLCFRKNEEILNDIKSLSDYKIQNGDHLLLI